ncbi:MAG: biotin carboxylase N-terminal domain-containing protein [Pseudomonadales bacterium]
MFHRVLIANRGAIARRVIQACNALGVESVALYSEADADAPYLAEATRALPLPGVKAADSYLNMPALLGRLAESGADAVHPGYGFLSESAGFARAVADAGAHFIGPAPHWLERMGDKVAARALMAERGFPVFAGSGALESLREARDFAAEAGYPLMLKPVGGGGGIGMQVLRDDADLAAAFERCARLADAAFADPRLFLETFCMAPRHVEIQVLGDGAGGAVHLYERACSLQLRHPKVVEESPAPGLERDALDALAMQAERITGELGYDNVGTVETLRAGDGRYGFLEMNTRVQVEHGVTEAVTGLDLVATQISLAAGGALPARPQLQGHALEVRVYAEHPRTALPSCGRLTRFRPPVMHGVRVDTGYAEGQTVTPYYDPLLAKVIGFGGSREQAIGRVLVALKGFEVLGVDTNMALLRAVLQDDDFLAGRIDTGYLYSHRW